jgi:peptide/nickel transport system permease protein
MGLLKAPENRKRKDMVPASGKPLQWVNEIWHKSLGLITRQPTSSAGVIILLSFILMAILATQLAPYGPLQYNYTNGQLARLLPPSEQFWLGTTYYGQDVLSQVIVGSRSALIVGFVAAFFLSFIGTNIGLISGYFGGRVDTVLMRLTDVAFGIPFLPFAIVLIAVSRPSIWNIIVTICCLLWRTTARVIRSQVLSLKERPFIKAAKVSGAGHLRILYLYLLPNVLPMSLLYVALGISWATLSEASLSFLGFGDPRVISWGQMLHYAFVTGAARSGWWVVLAPGFCITLFSLSGFMVGYFYEEVVNPRLRKRSR